jgi:hypothetical protein
MKKHTKTTSRTPGRRQLEAAILAAAAWTMMWSDCQLPFHGVASYSVLLAGLGAIARFCR